MRSRLIPLAAAGACTALVTASGCATGGGLRIEGVAESASGTASASATAPAFNRVQLLKQDPKVSQKVKDGLKPCGGEKVYPVDASYGDLTGGSAPDVVLTVYTCADGLGLGAYVYRMEDGKYVNVFTEEQPPVYAEALEDVLSVTRQIYAPSDPVCCASSEDVLTYRWRGGRFTQVARAHNDYKNDYEESSDG